MSDFKEFKNLKVHEGLFLFIGFFFFLSPGVLTIWHFAPGIVEASSTPKLILLAASAVAPLVFWNAMNVEWVLGTHRISQDMTFAESLRLQLNLGMVISGLIILVMLNSARNSDWTLNKFVLATLLLNLGATIICAVVALARWAISKRKT